MKRILAITAAALMLAGCSSQADSLTDEHYFSMVGELASFKGMPEANLADLGSGFCDVRETAEDSGFSQMDAGLQHLKMATDQGMSAGDIGSFMVFATARYCPQFLGEDGLASLLD
ncbi:lipoprotein [Homoserinimonas sp. A520]